MPPGKQQLLIVRPNQGTQIFGSKPNSQLRSKSKPSCRGAFPAGVMDDIALQGEVTSIQISHSDEIP
jgi:hypothetical protein